MARSIELEWREIIAHLDDTPTPPDDNGFAHWSVAIGVIGLLPMLAPETLPASLPFAFLALVFGLIGLRRSGAIGRGRTRAIVGVMLGAVPLITAAAIAVLAVVLLAP